MGYQVDFLPVGEGEGSGDAIALRFWDTTPIAGQKVFVIDGGTKTSGKALVDHIKTHYGTSHVDAVISTHPDGDHASGLSVVLEDLNVDFLIMHQPWNHAAIIKDLFEPKDLTVLGLQRKIKRELQYAHDLKKIADRKSITIVEPFAGTNGWNGLFHVLGPSQEYYQELLTGFDCTPEPLEDGLPGLIKVILPGQQVEWVREDWNTETLLDGAEHASAENSSSAIILFTAGTNLFLFTGDADEVALHRAANYAQSKNIDLSKLHLFQVPHHGSKQNVGPGVLNRIRATNAQISAGPAAPKHPSYAVMNALMRRGAKVYTTQGQAICHPSADAPSRAGWSTITPKQFSSVVQK